MLTYVYLVKCPHCEDEFFDFFDEAKEYALSCMSKKPIITQTEVTRNDFGECTDHCDLGTVWSWEDVMEETDAEPTQLIFTKDDFEDYIPDEDPEFEDIDNSVDFDIDEDYAINESNNRGAFVNNIDTDIFNELAKGVPEAPIITSFEKCSKSAPRNALYYVNAGEEVTFYLGNIKLPQKQVTHCWITHNGEVLQTRNRQYPDDLITKFSIDLVPGDVDKAINDIKNLVNSINGVNEARSGKPIPEGMTIEQLVEEMEENEDTVECTKCGGLFEKARCTHNKEGFGWCCTNCEPANTLIEDTQEEYDLAALVTDSINHLTNDLGKDPLADDFADDIIADIENNYDIEVPDVPEKYRDWASAIACEVSRQVNKSESASMLEELEDAKDYRKRLDLCPECGAENSFDHETGFCLECGFNL